METRPRAQQPQDSPGASLPTELLLKILKLSLVELAPTPRQAAVFTYQRVCLQWHDLATDLATQELFVASSWQAGRLASVVRSNAAKQKDVRSLTITVEKWTGAGGRGQRVADLLHVCTKLERLQLTLGDSLGQVNSKSGTLGPALLERMSRMNLVELELHGTMELPAESFREMLTGHSKLRVLIAPTLVLRNPSGQAKAYGRFTNQLEHLQISSKSLYYRQTSVAASLLESAIATLTRLRVVITGVDGPTIVSAVQPAAGRLIELDVVGDWDLPTYSRGCMERLLPTLASIRCLAIGHTSLRDLGQLFELLRLLTTLEHFTLKLAPKWSDLYPDLSAIRPASVSDYLTSATNLKSLTLPLSLRRHGWTTEDVVAVERTASLAGITFQLVDLES